MRDYHESHYYYYYYFFFFLQKLFIVFFFLHIFSHNPLHNPGICTVAVLLGAVHILLLFKLNVLEAITCSHYWCKMVLYGSPGEASETKSWCWWLQNRWTTTELSSKVPFVSPGRRSSRFPVSLKVALVGPLCSAGSRSVVFLFFSISPLTLQPAHIWPKQ